nr:MAG TPA: hypothetical protein [Caudoviricetes sp.]
MRLSTQYQLSTKKNDHSVFTLNGHLLFFCP